MSGLGRGPRGGRAWWPVLPGALPPSADADSPGVYRAR
ncbi:hypothetical protein CSE45_1832 [Citreicella sp. SE45]|nr:hypothetical protein CSE45_1832 [Citreicella sp. SE45]